MTTALSQLRAFLFACAGLLPLSMATLSSAPAQAQAADAASSLFKTNCSMCHGADGAGSELGKRLGVPDLRTKEVQQLAPAVIARTISAGKNQMPGFGTRLDEQQIQKLVDYIHNLHSEPPTAK